jgi:protein associated with RNAse G/E
MDNWVSENLVSIKYIKYTPTGYINNNIAIKYLDYLIKYSKASPNKPWKILLLNRYESHIYKSF